MLSKLRPRSLYDVMAAIACFGVLAGGTAYAANTIGSADVINNSLLSEDIKQGEVKAGDLGLDSVSSTRILNETVQGADVAANTLTGADINESTLVGVGGGGGCKPNGSGDRMVAAGAVCIDKYENSIWTAPEGGTQITGAIPCNANGSDCDNIFARSVPSVLPRANITWFQAQQALANVGKRLPSNAEWQQAVTGTPDDGTCNVSSGNLGTPPPNSACVSRFGAQDMVGNASEWVADWIPKADTCDFWPAGFGGDFSCLGDVAAPTSNFPGALSRGGNFVNGSSAGPFAVDSQLAPSDSSTLAGFRGAR
jgi:hypothetical protein